ncbi:MAG: response regulator [Magnetococcus sp. YQC-5]
MNLLSPNKKPLFLPVALVALPVAMVAAVALFFLHQASVEEGLVIIPALSLLLIALARGVGWLHERSLSNDLMQLAHAADKMAEGDMTIRVHLSPVSDMSQLGSAFNTMAERMEIQQREQLQNQWLMEGMGMLHKLLGKNVELVQLSASIVSFLTTYLDAVVGAFYVVGENGTLSLLGSYAYHTRKTSNTLFIPGEGVIGQVLLEKKYIIISRVPVDYMVARSGLIETAPKTLLVFPFLLHGEMKAIVELGTFSVFTNQHLTFLDRVAESVGMALSAAQSRARMQATLIQLDQQRKTVEETSQALRLSNASLEEQKKALQLSQAQLLEQQEELRVSNEELEEQAQLLEEQKLAADRKNMELSTTQEELQRRAKDLQLANQYKSEFLSNMSHELRTPLNSLLILAKSFMDNEDQNLHARQVEDAKIIYESGSDLLHLINEILDLSKIEAGRMNVIPELIDLPTFAADIIRRFNPVALSKGLHLSLEISTTKNWQPFRTDSEKLGRILKNLLANACKFTKKGWVKLRFAAPPKEWSPAPDTFAHEEAIAISVSDTGIGIPEEKRRLIFEAFQQADGSISRQYGGTGLGLTLSTQLARLLGGTIHLASEVGQGSVFTLILTPLPPSDEEPTQLVEPSVASPPTRQPALALKPDQPLAGSMGCAAGGIQEHNPWRGLGHPLNPSQASKPLQNHPDSNGLTPSPMPEPLTLPSHCSQSTPCALLLVEDDAHARSAMLHLLRNHPIQVTQAATGADALTSLQNHPFDCIILDLGLPDINGFDLLEEIAENYIGRTAPVIVYSGQELTRAEYDRLKKHTDSIVVKGNNSPTRLLNEMALVLTKNAPPPPTTPQNDSSQVNTFHDEQQKEHTELKNKIILIVDDDVRNTYAMTRQLEQHHMKVHMAANGVKALEAIAKHPEIECVLMDVMMPVMDGLEAIRQLRARPESATLPIIALTAKATEEDRRSALEAGANDYLPKPVDKEMLFVKLGRVLGVS